MNTIGDFPRDCPRAALAATRFDAVIKDRFPKCTLTVGAKGFLQVLKAGCCDDLVSCGHWMVLFVSLNFQHQSTCFSNRYNTYFKHFPLMLESLCFMFEIE